MCERTDKEMRKHYEELFIASVDELKMYRLYVEHLLQILDEVKELTNDELLKAIIENGINRHNLDKLIHSKLLFR